MKFKELLKVVDRNTAIFIYEFKSDGNGGVKQNFLGFGGSDAAISFQDRPVIKVMAGNHLSINVTLG